MWVSTWASVRRRCGHRCGRRRGRPCGGVGAGGGEESITSGHVACDFFSHSPSTPPTRARRSRTRPMNATLRGRARRKPGARYDAHAREARRARDDGGGATPSPPFIDPPLSLPPLSLCVRGGGRSRARWRRQMILRTFVTVVRQVVRKPRRRNVMVHLERLHSLA